MKFYSEELKALFNSVEELETAEAKHKAETEGKAQAIKDITTRFEKCVKEIDNIINDVVELSDTLSPAEEKKLMHSLVETMSGLSLPLFWQI